MKVEELSMYGKSFDILNRSLKNQRKILFTQLRKEFRIFEILEIALAIKKHSKRIRKEFPEAIMVSKCLGEGLLRKLILVASLYSAIVDKRGRKFSKKFISVLMQNIAPISMPHFYQLRDLVKCEGDVFNNLKKFNCALFTGNDKKGSWINNGFHETTDLLEFKISSCSIVQFFKEINCSDIVAIGCDYGIAGYALIGEAVQCGFKRTGTIAEGSNCCHFCFYRKGTIPPAENKSIIKL